MRHEVVGPVNVTADVLGGVRGVAPGGVPVTGRAQALGAELFREPGIEPAERKLLRVKSTGPLIAFGPNAAKVLHVGPDGPMSRDHRKISYTRIQRPIRALDGETTPGLIARWRKTAVPSPSFDCLTCAAATVRTPAFRHRTLWAVPTQSEALGTEIMANTASARKRIRQTVVRTARNAARKSRMRTFVKKVETAIASGDKTGAVAALRAAQPEMQRASGKGVVHANTVARKLSRLSARIKALASA
jgi:small subunit ribosomal protein S20